MHLHPKILRFTLRASSKKEPSSRFRKVLSRRFVALSNISWSHQEDSSQWWFMMTVAWLHPNVIATSVLLLTSDIIWLEKTNHPLRNHPPGSPGNATSTRCDLDLEPWRPVFLQWISGKGWSTLWPIRPKLVSNIQNSTMLPQSVWMNWSEGGACPMVFSSIMFN